jgi:hypothetical protein
MHPLRWPDDHGLSAEPALKTNRFLLTTATSFGYSLSNKQANSVAVDTDSSTDRRTSRSRRYRDG